GFVCGPLQFALVVRGRLRALVVGSRTDWIRRNSGGPGGLSDGAGDWGVHLPGRWHEGSEPAFPAVAAGTAVWNLRCRYPHRPGAGRVDHRLAVADIRLADHFRRHRIPGAGLAGAVVSGNAAADARPIAGRRAANL